MRKSQIKLTLCNWTIANYLLDTRTISPNGSVKRVAASVPLTDWLVNLPFSLAVSSNHRAKATADIGAVTVTYTQRECLRDYQQDILPRASVEIIPLNVLIHGYDCMAPLGAL